MEKCPDCGNWFQNKRGVKIHQRTCEWRRKKIDEDKSKRAPGYIPEGYRRRQEFTQNFINGMKKR